jgi:hypothetical protein
MVNKPPGDLLKKQVQLWQNAIHSIRLEKGPFSYRTEKQVSKMFLHPPPPQERPKHLKTPFKQNMYLVKQRTNVPVIKKTV